MTPAGGSHGNPYPAARIHISLSSMAAWPIAAGAQQTDRMRRIGLLMNRAADNPEGQDRIAASTKVCRNWAGALATMCGSILAGAEPGQRQRS
jgi:hypothetical protein